MAKSDKLKGLIKALGGEPPRTDSISDCLDALCDCNIGGAGGGASEALPLIIFTENQDTYEWSCNKTFDECLELVNNGTFIAMRKTGSSTTVLTDYDRFESDSGTELYFTAYDFNRQVPCGVMWTKYISGEVDEIYGDYVLSQE